MKYILVICLFLFAQNIFSQELTVNGKYGYTIGEMKAFKKIMLYTGVDINVEWKLKEDIFFCIGAGANALQFSFNDTSSTSVFDKKYFLNFPVSIKKYYPLSRKSSYFLQFGIMNSFLIHDKKEIFLANEKQVVNSGGPGYNLAMLFNTGFKTMISTNWNFGLALGGYQDFVLVYKDKAKKIKTTTTILSFSFTRKI